MKKNSSGKTAAKLHEDVPPDWYYRSLKEDPLQRYWHNRRFDEVVGLADPVKGEILDIGSADGVFSKRILEKTGAKKITGIDVLKTSVDWANKHWKDKRMKFRVADAHELPFKTNSFEAVFALEVLEHVVDPVKVLGEVRRVLKKGGYAIFLVPSENSLFKIVWFLWHFYGRMVWEDTHVQHFDNSSLTKLAKKNKFEIVEDKKFILGMLHVLKVRKK